MADTIGALTREQLARLRFTVLQQPGAEPQAIADEKEWQRFIADGPAGLYLVQETDRPDVPGFDKAAEALLRQTGELYADGSSAGRWTDAVWYAEGLLAYVAKEIERNHPGAKLIVRPILRDAPRFGINPGGSDPRIGFMAHAVTMAHNGEYVSISLTNLMQHLSFDVLRKPGVINTERGGWEINLHELAKVVERNEDLYSYTTRMQGPHVRSGESPGPNPFNVQLGLVHAGMDQKKGRRGVPSLVLSVRREMLPEVEAVLADAVAASHSPALREMAQRNLWPLKQLPVGLGFSAQDEDRLLLVSGPAFFEVNAVLQRYFQAGGLQIVDARRFPQVVQRLNSPEYYDVTGGNVHGDLQSFIDDAQLVSQSLARPRQGGAMQAPESPAQPPVEMPERVVVPFVLNFRKGAGTGANSQAAVSAALEEVIAIAKQYYPQRCEQWQEGHLDRNAVENNMLLGVLPHRPDGAGWKATEPLPENGLVAYMDDSTARLLGAEGIAELQARGLMRLVTAEEALVVEPLIRPHFKPEVRIEWDMERVLQSGPVSRQPGVNERVLPLRQPPQQQEEGAAAASAPPSSDEPHARLYAFRARQPQARFTEGFAGAGLHDGSARSVTG